MANSNGWGDGAGNNAIGWGQGANNAIAWGDSHAKSWAGATDIVGIDSDAQAYFAATGITGATQQAAIDNLVKGFKADGIWSKMKAVYPFVTDNINLASYTEDFSNAFWIKLNATVTSNTTIAPNGTTTADTVNFTSGSIYFSTTLSGVYTFSVYLKYKGSQWACVENYNAPTDKAAWFDIQNGVLGTTSNAVSSSIESVGNGWYRCSVTTNASNAYPSLFAFFTTTTNGGFTRNNDLYAWGAQVELGSTATTYQPIATTQQAYIASQFKFNLVNPVDSDAAFRLVFNGGWTHSSTGATPNGTNGYADTKFNANTNLTNGNFHLSFYSRTNSTSGSFSAEMLLLSTYASTGWIALRTNNKVSGNAIVTFGDDANESAGASSTTSGFMVGTETSNSLRKVFKNNSLLGQNTTTSTTAITSSNIALSGSAVSSYSANQVAFTSMGNGLTDTEAANLYTRVQAYQTALSRQV
jgi:hypothetical protein